MKKINIYIILLLLVVFTLSSCKKYLEVSPKSTLLQSEIFASEIGFQQALSGVYATLSSTQLYADNLTMGFASALGQNYDTRNSGNILYKVSDYDYSTDVYKNTSIAIWRQGYNVIAGLNNIIIHTEKNRSVLSTTNYNLIRGEALALRAYMHFDLLRLFGKSMIVGANDKAIPYRTSLDQYGTVPSTTSQVIELALKDLTEAVALLKQSDPIVLTRTKNRQIKMNYYAARGLQARIMLYGGKSDQAYTVAKEVVDAGIFPFTASSDLAKDASTKDRLLRGELIFGLRNRDMSTWVNKYFRLSGNVSYGLTRSQTEWNEIYESNTTDKRRTEWFEEDQNNFFPSKYWQTYSQIAGSNDSVRLDQFLPMMRISEMRLIIAETTPNLSEGIAQVSAIRAARDVTGAALPATLTKSALMTEIRKEYEKDMYGEGQLFFFHKRINSTSIRFYSVSPLNSVIYKLPIPDAELEYNPTY